MRPIVMIAAPVHPVPPKHGAAVEWWMYQVSRRLTKFRPTIVCNHAAGYALEEDDGNAHIRRIRIGSAYQRLFQKITRLDPYSYAHRAARIIREVDAAIVHVHNAPKLFHRLIDLGENKNAQYILHMHNEMDVGSVPPATSMITCSRSLARWYQGRSNAPIDVVTNGVDTAQFPATWDLSAQVRERRSALGIPLEHKILLYAGRLSPEKGPLDLVLAFRELLQHRRDVYLMLVGELRQGESSNPRVRYGNEIMSACAAINNHCRLVGTVDPTIMPSYYSLADMVVVPSEFDEPFGMVALEAMAAGVPVLAARKGGLTEFIRDNDTGFFINDTKDHAQLARQMDQLLGQSHQLDTVRRRAREYVLRHHDWSEVVRQIEEVYERVLASDAAQRMAS